MELNIATTPSSEPIPRRPSSETTSQKKGSWKQRRKEQLIERARLRKKEKQKQAPKGLRNTAKDFARLADEYASGLETQRKPSATPTDDAPSRASKKRRLATGGQKETAEERLVAGSRVNGAASGIVKKRVRVPDASSTAEQRQTDQSPHAVSATLAAITGEGESKTNAATTATDLPKSTDEQHTKEASTIEKESAQKKESVTSFIDTGLYHSVCHHVTERLKIQQPTPVQEKVLQSMLNIPEGKLSLDLLVRSPTGSGKTLAYLLPVAHYLLKREKRVSREEGTYAMVIVPTRELAEQVADVAASLFQLWHWIVVGSVSGGESKKREKARLRKGINVLVATPGRILDHMRNTQSFTYGICEFLILDEADRLLDLGFENDIKEVIQNIDNQAKLQDREGGKICSNILLSATLRKDIEKLAEFSLEDPVEIGITTEAVKRGARFEMPSELRQHFCIVEQRYRLVTLACFLRLRAMKDSPKDDGESDRNLAMCKIIVFFSSCDSVDFHYSLLKATKLPEELRQPHSGDVEESFLPLSFFRIHGNHSQADRTQSLRGFRRSNRAVLLCTDVAARGLDLKGLNFAIQYDPPTGGDGEELEYMHRAGRTARMGARGDALLFLLPSERTYVGKLKSKGVNIEEISGSAALAALYPKADLTNTDAISYATRLVTSAVQTCFEQVVAGDAELKHQAVSGFQAYCRAYATHAREVRYFFHVRNLHLGHVARAFVLSDKPAEFSEMMAEIKRAKAEAKNGLAGAAADRSVWQSGKKGEHGSSSQTKKTELSRRRRERGIGASALAELALEFAS